ncbi:MAG: hypothetical protein RSP_20050 [Rhodanobacter sp.]
METSALTFVSLNERIEALPAPPSQRVRSSRKQRWGIALFATAGSLALIVAKVHSARPWLIFVLPVLLAVELVGFTLMLIAALPDLIEFKLGFAAQRREFAESLDFDMPHHEATIAWLSTYPRERLETMRDFAAYRIERFRSKLPLATGGIEKLGMLPVLAALVVQFKDADWPPHPSGLRIVLFAVLMLSYWLCMALLSLRFRLELYGALLGKALDKKMPGTL